MLTNDQVIQFDTFGFLVLGGGVLTPEELDTINSEFETGLATAERDMDRQTIRKQLNWSNLGPGTPYLASLLEDPRFSDAAEQILGEAAVGSYCNSNSFNGDRTEWHPDSTTPHWRGFKFAFYPQPVYENTGALRLIPGSHKEPFHSELQRITLKESAQGAVELSGLSVEDVPAYAARSEPGDVVAFDNHTWHASWGGSTDRRMCSQGYFFTPTPPEEEGAIRVHVKQDAQIIQAFPQVRRHPNWIDNAEGSPRRQRWIDALRKWGFIGADSS